MMKQLIAILLIAVSMSLFSAEKYAVLIAGDYEVTGVPTDAQWNTGTDKPNTEFWNDLYLQWEMLYEKGYKKENIKVLFAKGTDLWLNPDYQYIDKRYKAENATFNIGETITNYAATEANVEAVCAELGSKMEYGEDFLYVWVMSHSTISGLYLMKDDLTGSRYVSYSTFADYFKPLNALNKVYLLSMNGAQALETQLQQDNAKFITSKESVGVEINNK